MSKTLRLAEDLALPIEAVTEKLAFLGRTGTGKTYAAMKLAELMLEAGAQIVVLDFVGKWYGLRVPGVGDPFPIPVFGGLHGDYPLESTGGRLVADLIVDRNISAVLDVSQFTRGEQIRFALDFGTQFFQRKKALPSAVHLFLEECQEVLPQNPQPNEGQMLGAFERIWKLGRNFGIGGSLISQRPQEVNKKALNMSGTLFVFQMTGPQERKTIESWVTAQDINEDIAEVLPTLTKGRPHVWSVAFEKPISKTVQVSQKRTADVSATLLVDPGKRKEKPLTPIDAAELTAAMAATIERAKADDPKELRRRIGELERQLKVKAPLKNSAAGENSSGKIRDVEVLTDADRELLKAVRDEFLIFSENITAKADTMLTSIAERAKAEIDSVAGAWTKEVEGRRRLFLERLEKTRVQKVLDKVDRVSVSNPVIKSPAQTLAQRPAQPNPKNTPIRQPARPGPAGSGDVAVGNSGLRRMLIALAQRQQGLNRRQLGVRAGLSSRSGTFDTYLSRARQAGWVNGTGQLQITDAGLTALGSYDPLPAGRELLAYWLGELGQSGAARILTALSETYPRGMSRADLGAASGLSDRSGTFDTYLSRLRTLELIEGRGEIRASEELFG